METIKTCNNASNLYILENQEILLNQSNNIQEDKEIINLLKKELLILQEESETTYLVSEYQKSKQYEIDKNYFIDPESEDTEEIQDEKKDIIPAKIISNKQLIAPIAIIILGIILFQTSKMSNTVLATNVLQAKTSNTKVITTDTLVNKNLEQLSIKSEFTILTEKANINRYKIAKKLELQKELRLKKENINNEINKLKSEVYNIEKENLNIRNELINISNLK